MARIDFHNQIEGQLSKYTDAKGKGETSLKDQFYATDEFLYLPQAFDSEWINHEWVPLVNHCKKYLHRNYIPFQKKGGSVSYMTLGQQAIPIVQFYRSNELCKLVESITDEKILLCPETDPHACALYYYTEG